MTLLAEQVPEDHRELIRLVADPELLGAFDEGFLGIAPLGDAGEVALDVGGEDRHAGARKTLGHHLQRHGLAGSGCAGHEAMPVRQTQ